LYLSRDIYDRGRIDCVIAGAGQSVVMTGTACRVSKRRRALRFNRSGAAARWRLNHGITRQYACVMDRLATRDDLSDHAVQMTKEGSVRP
jgi:hypothetical protein